MISTRGAVAPAGGRAGSRSRRVKAAIRNAAVLPVPVCDWPATSLPLRASGSAASWIAVAVTKPASRIPCITWGGSSSVSKFIRRPSHGSLGDHRGRLGAAAEDAGADDADLVEDDKRT